MYLLKLACLQFLGIQRGIFQVSVVRVSRKVSLIESLECGCLSNHDTIVESLGLSLLVV